MYDSDRKIRPIQSKSGVVIVTAVFATAFAFIAQTYAQNNGLESSTVALIFALEPVFALLIDILVGVFPSIQVIVGMVFILIAMVLTALKGSDSQQDQ